MAKRRRFTPEFKAELVFEVISGVSSQAEVCRRHNLNENQLSEWKRHVLENASSLFESTDKQSSDDQKRIAHLEQLVGRIAVALDIQKKLLTELDSRYLRSDATFRKPCKRSIPMAKRRRFTPEFKAEVVLEALRGESSQAELCRRHNLSQDQLSKWKQQVR